MSLRAFNELEDAKRSVEHWIDVEELLRWLANNRLSQISSGLGLALFTADDWLEASGLEKTEASKRGFERWKKKFARPAGILVDYKSMDESEAERVRRSFPSEVAELDHYLLLTEGVAERLEEAIRRRDEIESRVAGLRKKKARKTPIKQAMDALGISYTPGRVATWAERGAPIDRVRKGSREFFFTETQELDKWIESAVSAGTIKDPTVERLPIAEARDRILAAIAQSGLTKREFAQRTGINYGTLESYVLQSAKVRKVPLDFVLAAEVLGRSSPGREFHSPYVRTGTPPLSVIREEIAQAQGNLSESERRLRALGYKSGITASNLGVIARAHGIPYVTRRVEKPSKDELLRVLEEHDYNLSHAAKSFGFSGPTLARLVDEHGLRQRVEARTRPFSKADLEDAVAHAGPNASAAGELLGISESHFRLLLREHGLRDWFNSLIEAEELTRRETLREKYGAELRTAIESGETRRQLAKRLKRKRTTLEGQLRRLGLLELYKQLKQDPGAKARGSTRFVDPGAEKIPFWLAALRELRGTHAGRGGGRELAGQLGVSAVALTNWLKGRRAPGYGLIERIMALSGRPMPDWYARVVEHAQKFESRNEAARALGIEGATLTNLINRHGRPSEKLMERILGPDFWVAAVPEPETGSRQRLAMGSGPPVEEVHGALQRALIELLEVYRSQRALANDLSISVTTINKLLHGRETDKSSAAVIAKIARLYRDKLGRDLTGVQKHVVDPDSVLGRALQLYPSQAALARDLDVSQGHLSKIVRGTWALSPEIAARLEGLVRKNPHGLQYVLALPGSTREIGPEGGQPVSGGIAKYVSPHGSYRYVYYEAGQPVSGLQVMSRDGRSGVIAYVFTLPERRRGRLAARLLEQARRDFVTVEHAAPESLSELGQAWKRGVERNMNSGELVRREQALVPVQAPSGMYYPPAKLDFARLARGELPLVYTSGDAQPVAQVQAALSALVFSPAERGLVNPRAWDDLLAAAGRRAGVWVVDRSGERWQVLEVLFDPGGETGQLVLRHLGRRARQGELLVDLQDAYGFMIPVVVYKGTKQNPIRAYFGRSRDPIEVSGPAYPGSADFWDARVDGEDVVVPAAEIYSERGHRWRDPPKRKPAWKKNMSADERRRRAERTGSAGRELREIQRTSEKPVPPDLLVHAIKLWWESKKEYAGDLSFGARFWTPEEWRAKGERFGLDAALVMTQEGSFNRVLSYPESQEDDDLVQEWNDMLADLGWHWESLAVWAFGFYPDSKRNCGHGHGVNPCPVCIAALATGMLAVGRKK